MQHMQNSAELHQHLELLTLNHRQSNPGSCNSHCLPVCFHHLPELVSSHEARHKRVLITRAGRGGKEKEKPIYQAGNHSSTEAASKAAKAVNLKGESDWTAKWHSLLLSHFNILRIQMWLPTYCYNLTQLPHSFFPQMSTVFSLHI